MNIDDKIYVSICVFFAVLVVVGNLIYQKFVSLPIFSIHTFELSVGAILYPLTFLLTDLITEFYGKEKSRFCVKLTIVMNLIVASIIMLMDSLSATGWSKIDNELFHLVFGKYGVNFIASMIACYVAQYVDIKIYLWIKNATKNKFLWLRSNGSTAISLLIDTSLVISILCIFNVLPPDRMFSLIASSYSFKFFFTICSTPIFYLAVQTVKVIKKNSNC